ncbi:hypothetical protein K431DRAFT_122586 [Polychaeton citri CBS 116435]|uniref:Uncharacterized protein n=1 Tax=Polychaeton citri CBS 116435 TaxID=1314669 RepID=A0A9P4UNK0_9PEZI|nr:hypothetical protein K431DRAFT_122586 [Polychaeton citri CBS 116435]
MCYELLTHLTYGHSAGRILYTCEVARSAPDQNSRFGGEHRQVYPVLQVLVTWQIACCERCFARIFRGVLREACQFCRRRIVSRLAMAVISLSSRHESASDSRSDEQLLGDQDLGRRASRSSTGRSDGSSTQQSHAANSDANGRHKSSSSGTSTSGSDTLCHW